MPTRLQELLDEPRRNGPTPQEKEEQRRSFAYGNTKVENPRITRDMINKAADELGIPTHLSRSVVAE
jgi:hypothetical protein